MNFFPAGSKLGIVTINKKFLSIMHAIVFVTFAAIIIHRVIQNCKTKHAVGQIITPMGEILFYLFDETHTKS
jgi:hypothetical protein